MGLSHQCPQIPSMYFSLGIHIQCRICHTAPFRFHTVCHHIAVITPFNLVFSFIFHPCPGYNGRKKTHLMPIFCGATLQFDEAGLQRISVNSSRENIRHFSALIIFSMQLKVPQVKLYYVPPPLWIPRSCEVAACVIFDFHSEFWANHDCR